MDIEPHAPGVARMPGVTYSAATIEPEQAEKLTEDQRDGLACIRCGAEDTAMVPSGLLDGGQVFQCSTECAAP